jgi:hypothetical protein
MSSAPVTLPTHPDLLAAAVSLAAFPPRDLTKKVVAEGLASAIAGAGVPAPLVPLVAEVLVLQARMLALPREGSRASAAAVAVARVALLRAQAALFLACLPTAEEAAGADWSWVGSLAACEEDLDSALSHWAPPAVTRVAVTPR